ncbi:MAG: hypothetical protein JWM21_2550 [Acidobacteria bacterium]|nr:hypothetical protein [Acidobacteriota bacterium]
MKAVTSASNPKKYGKLLARVRPTVITTEDENDRMLALVEKLMAKGDSLTPEEGELLRLLGKLIADFEEEFYQLEDAAPQVGREYPLRGQPIEYVDPAEPVWPSDAS